jgi:hypothetical protein
MIVPDSQIFNAGDIQTGSTYNGSFTDLGNFVLGKPVFYGTNSVSQTVNTSLITGVSLTSVPVDRDNIFSAAPRTLTFTAASYTSATVATFTTLEPHGLTIGDKVVSSGFSLASYNVTAYVFNIISTTQYEALASGATFTNPWSGTAGIGINIPDYKVTIQTKGWYLVFGGAAWAATAATGLRQINLYKNGLKYPTIDWSYINYTVNSFIQPFPPQYLYFEQGDQVMLVVQQTSGGNLTLNVTGDQISSLGLIWVSN